MFSHGKVLIFRIHERNFAMPENTIHIEQEDMTDETYTSIVQAFFTSVLDFYKDNKNM